VASRPPWARSGQDVHPTRKIVCFLFGSPLAKKGRAQRAEERKYIFRRGLALLNPYLYPYEGDMVLACK
jgi:hypothetical protein